METYKPFISLNFSISPMTPSGALAPETLGSAAYPVRWQHPMYDYHKWLHSITAKLTFLVIAVIRTPFYQQALFHHNYFFSKKKSYNVHHVTTLFYGPKSLDFQIFYKYFHFIFRFCFYICSLFACVFFSDRCILSSYFSTCCQIVDKCTYSYKQITQT